MSDDTQGMTPDRERGSVGLLSRRSAAAGDRRQAAAAGGHAASRNPAGLEGWTDTTKRKREGDSPMGMTKPRTATVRFSPMRKCSPPAGGEGERSERTESE